jgi:hypothetical protein
MTVGIAFQFNSEFQSMLMPVSMSMSTSTSMSMSMSMSMFMSNVERELVGTFCYIVNMMSGREKEKNRVGHDFTLDVHSNPDPDPEPKPKPKPKPDRYLEIQMTVKNFCGSL